MQKNKSTVKVRTSMLSTFAVPKAYNKGMLHTEHCLETGTYMHITSMHNQQQVFFSKIIKIPLNNQSIVLWLKQVYKHDLTQATLENCHSQLLFQIQLQQLSLIPFISANWIDRMVYSLDEMCALNTFLAKWTKLDGQWLWLQLHQGLICLLVMTINTQVVLHWWFPTEFQFRLR